MGDRQPPNMRRFDVIPKPHCVACMTLCSSGNPTRLSRNLNNFRYAGCCQNFVQAGIVIYGNDDNYIKLVHVSIFNTRQTEFAKELSPVPAASVEPLITPGMLGCASPNGQSGRELTRLHHHPDKSPVEPGHIL